MKLTSSELRVRAEAARESLRSCVLCGHRCGVDRLAGKLGRCGCGADIRVAASLPHKGEEPCLGPLAGTVFFSGCNLKCAYCQNWQISWGNEGDDSAADKVSAMMLELEGQGCANIDLVSPTQWVPQILEALAVARERGLTLPVVYNTGGYDSPEALNLLDGAIDIYMPDMRYNWGGAAERYSGAKNYPEVNQAAVREMYRQVGDLVMDDNGRATRGLLVRLLLLPADLSGTRDTLNWMAANLSTETWFSLMSQYTPKHKAGEFPEIDRPIKEREYLDVLNYIDKLGFTNFYTQAPESKDSLAPDFDKADPFEN